MHILILLALSILSTLLPSTSWADQSGDVKQCNLALAKFQKAPLDEFNIRWDQNIFVPNEIKSNDVICEVNSDGVWTLIVSGEELVREGFWGKEAIDGIKSMTIRTSETIEILEGRIRLLRDRLDSIVSQMRGKKDPDVQSAIKYIDEGIDKSL